jgi:hypothetical protein
MGKLGQIKHIWSFEGISLFELASDVSLDVFEQRYQVVLPPDLRDYFKQLNGTQQLYDSHMFQFYELKSFVPIRQLYDDWEGVPDYGLIPSTLKNHQQVYVFANFSNHLYAYGIRLYSEAAEKNEIYVICGGDYHPIAESFTQFVDLYLEDNEALYF